MTVCSTCGSATANQNCSACGLAATSGATTTSAAYGQARFVGDAAPVAGIPISRMLNALCYIVTGIALFIVAGQGVSSAWVAVLIGIGAIGYGLKILLTRSSYWITSIVYLAPIAAIGWAITAMSH